MNSAAATSTVLRKIALVGNPNVGKSVLFGQLTGQYVMVSNYPGTTVEVSRGTAPIYRETFEIIDTPGVNSLIPQSEDERVTRDILLTEKPDLIIQVADAKNLRRSLLLTLQLAELECPLVIDLNMIDECRTRGIVVDSKSISSLFGVPVVETIATTGEGFRKLFDAVKNARIPQDPHQGDSQALTAQIRSQLGENPRVPPRLSVEWLAAPDEALRASVENLIPKEKLSRIQTEVEQFREQFHQSAASMIHRERMAFLDQHVDSLRTVMPFNRKVFFEKLGRWSREPLTGIPILLVVLFLMYEFVGVLGAQTAVNFLEKTLFGRYIVPVARAGFNRFLPFPFIDDLFVGPYGLISMALSYAVAIVLPIVGTFFLAFGFLEDSGYLPRLSILSDRLFRAMGLNGKAVLPLILGLGCDTMATVTTRVLATKKERIIATLLLALGIPCSAQLGVILGITAGISRIAVFTIFGTVTLQVFLVGYLSSLIVRGRRSDFIFEIPPIRIPQLRNIGFKTWMRMKWYVREAVPLFVLGTLLLFVLDKLRILNSIIRATEPVVVKLLGLPSEAATAFILGFLRRDYGAAGLYRLAENGLLDHVQIVIALVTMTLFVPCTANFFMMIKEHGWKRAVYIALVITPIALGTGGALNWILHHAPEFSRLL
ncbi:MAG: ferrous iron transport protein B [Acidobacteriia bacterium]|nr:ferrous iron transport protein B [Terriglobia bacterium]